MKWLALLILLVGCTTHDPAIFSDVRREFWLNRFDNLPESSEVNRAWIRFWLCELPPEQRPECE